MSELSSIEFQAAQWIDHRTGGEPFDETAFNAWLIADPQRRSVFDAMWRHIMGPDMDVALRAYERRGASRRIWLASGAAILIAMVAAGKAVPMIELQFARPLEYAAGAGSIREVKLADGTQLTLAGGTNVRIRYTRHDRRVELTRGTLFANVIHDERRPFSVHTGNARVVDIGTSFEVSNRPGTTRVTVASGVVQFGKDGWFNNPITLNVKQAAVLDGTGLNRIADVSPNSVARWRGGWAEYRGAPLRQVVADLQPLSPLQIDIADESLASRPVGGRIRLTDPIGQLQNLAIIHDFQVRRLDHTLVLAKK